MGRVTIYMYIHIYVNFEGGCSWTTRDWSRATPQKGPAVLALEAFSLAPKHQKHLL